MPCEVLGGGERWLQVRMVADVLEDNWIVQSPLGDDEYTPERGPVR
jgi:hypothetical protein